MRPGRRLQYTGDVESFQAAGLKMCVDSAFLLTVPDIENDMEWYGWVEIAGCLSAEMYHAQYQASWIKPFARDKDRPRLQYILSTVRRTDWLPESRYLGSLQRDNLA